MSEANDIEFINILNQTKDQAVCSILRIKDTRIMLDCGCNENMDIELLDIVLKEALNVHFIMLSHSSRMCVGALAYLHRNGVTARIIATSPIAKLGAMTMHELYISNRETPRQGNSGKPEKLTAFTLKDVEESFSTIELVSF